MLAGKVTKAIAQSEIVLNRDASSLNAVIVNAIGNLKQVTFSGSETA